MQSTPGISPKQPRIRKERPEVGGRDIEGDKKEKKHSKPETSQVTPVRARVGALRLVEQASPPRSSGVRKMASILLPTALDRASSVSPTAFPSGPSVLPQALPPATPIRQSALHSATPPLPPAITTTQQFRYVTADARELVHSRNEKASRRRTPPDREKPGSTSSSRVSSSGEKLEARPDDAKRPDAPREKKVPTLQLLDLDDRVEPNEKKVKRPPGLRDGAAIEAFRRPQIQQFDDILALYGETAAERKTFEPSLRKSLAALSSKDLKALKPSDGEIKQVYRYYAEKKLVPSTASKLTSRLETDRALALPHEERLALVRAEFKTYFSQPQAYEKTDALRNGSHSLTIAADMLTEWSQATAARILGTIEKACGGGFLAKKTDKALFEKVMTKMLGGLDEDAMDDAIHAALPDEFCELFATAHAELDSHFGPAFEPRSTDDKAVAHMVQRRRQVGILDLNFLGQRSLTTVLIAGMAEWPDKARKKGMAVVQALTAAMNGASGTKATEGRLDIDLAQSRKWHAAFSKFAERVQVRGQECLANRAWIRWTRAPAVRIESHRTFIVVRRRNGARGRGTQPGMSPPSIDHPVPRSVFTRLVIEVCACLGVPAPEVELSAHAPAEPHPAVAMDFIVDDVELALVHASGVNAARVKLVCRLGICPAHRRLEVFERLLVLNVALADEPVRLALDPADGTALLINDLALADLDVARTLHAIDSAVQQAERWRAGYFLESDSIPAQPARVDLACALMA